MAIEEEFGIEIPDAEADEITNVAQGEPTFLYLDGAIISRPHMSSMRLALIRL
jgi:hypothetical protein